MPKFLMFIFKLIEELRTVSQVKFYDSSEMRVKSSPTSDGLLVPVLHYEHPNPP